MGTTLGIRLAVLAGAVLTFGVLALLLSMCGGKEAQAQVQNPGLSSGEVKQILAQGVAKANLTASVIRSLPTQRRTTKMFIAVVARDGRLLESFSMPDVWVGSPDLATAKARTAAFFSSNENALTTRIVGVLSQAHNPDGSGGAGPLWGIWASNQGGVNGPAEFRNGIAPFPGGVPLYKGNTLVGSVGVDGDGVDQDEAVAFAAATGFAPGPLVAKLGF